MRKAIKQISVCALGLLVFCLFCRLTFFRTYTARIPLLPYTEAAGTVQAVSARIEKPEIMHTGDIKIHQGHVRIPIHGDRAGETDLQIYDPQGKELAYTVFRVSPAGTVFDLQTGGFTGDTAVLIAVTLFWAAVSAIMIWHYFQAKGPAYYAYSTIYYAGFSIFSLVTALLMLRVTVMHIIRPDDYSMFAAYNTINGASREFMKLTMPVILAFALAMAVSNAALLLHERHRLWNALGLMVSGLLVAGEALGLYLFTRDFSGSEWAGRLQSTLENVYATIFVYFECMLAGSVICGITAARHQPAPDKDFIIILGCWFRNDGSLPPLLKGRVDCAVTFWKKQKEISGREAVLIPSGGQGPDEPMPEAEAMRRYLAAQDIPASLICTETESASTYQNMVFSKKKIDGINPHGKTIFATTNYHVFRSGVWAGQAGLPAEGIGGKTRWWFWPNAFMRECAGLLQKRWKQEILLLILLILFFGILSIILG